MLHEKWHGLQYWHEYLHHGGSLLARPWTRLGRCHGYTIWSMTSGLKDPPQRSLQYKTLQSLNSPIHKYRNMRPCTRTVCWVVVLSGVALTGWTWDRQFGGRSELLANVGPDPVSSKRATVRCITALPPTVKRTTFVGSWKNVEGARKSSRLWLFLWNNSSSELALSAWASSR